STTASTTSRARSADICPGSRGSASAGRESPRRAGSRSRSRPRRSRWAPADRSLMVDTGALSAMRSPTTESMPRTGQPAFRLVGATGETATLSAPGERDAVTVDFVQSPSSVQGVARLGRPSIAHATATGKVLLAFGHRTLPPGQLKAYTESTITQRAALSAEL